MTRADYHRQLFLSAAIFNWLVGFGFIFLYRPVLGVLAPETLPQHTLFLHLFAVVVICFGISYLQISRDCKRHPDLIKQGALAKAAIFFMVFGYWLGELIDWKLLSLAAVDLIYSLLFIECLRYQRQQAAPAGPATNNSAKSNNIEQITEGSKHVI